MTHSIVDKVKTDARLVAGAWAHWLHFVYAAILIATYFITGALEQHDAKVLIAYVGVFIYVLVLLALLAYFIISYSRKARYAEAMTCVHSAVHRLRDSVWYLEECMKNPEQYESEKFIESVRAALDSVAQAFSIVTAVSNRVCIKVLGTDGGEQYARTLCRDTASHARNRERDRDEGTKHKVNRNTAFQIIVGSERRYFLCPNVREYPNYDNTSGAPEALPYVSCVVFPIRYVLDTTDMQRSGQAKRIHILGFLAIDSAARRAYSERYDVEMGAVIADALYIVLDHWSRVDAYVRRQRATPGMQAAAAS